MTDLASHLRNTYVNTAVQPPSNSKPGGKILLKPNI